MFLHNNQTYFHNLPQQSGGPHGRNVSQTHRSNHAVHNMAPTIGMKHAVPNTDDSQWVTVLPLLYVGQSQRDDTTTWKHSPHHWPFALRWAKMGAMASQITSLTIVYSTVYSDADQRKEQSSASLAFVRGIHRGPVNSPHKWPVTRKMFPFDDVIMVRGIHRSPVDSLAKGQWCVALVFLTLTIEQTGVECQDAHITSF